MVYSKVYLDDLKKVCDIIPDIEYLKDKTILITGANGLICSALVDMLIELNSIKKLGITIYICARSQEKSQERFRGFFSKENVHFMKYDVNEELVLDDNIDYIIHGASNANPGTYTMYPVETMMTNLIGMRNILEFARKSRVNRVLYISSSEVYGNKKTKEPYKEDDYYSVDILNPRACYPSSKRAAETMCASYLKEYGVDFVIARPGHIYGPTVTEPDNRASSQFSKDVIEGHDIVMKSAGLQIRSYCYVLDCVSALLTILIKGNSGEAYNISNRESISTIRDIAEAFAKAGECKVVFEKPSDEEKAGYNLMDNSSLASDKLEKLGWVGIFDLITGTTHTIMSMKNK